MISSQNLTIVKLEEMIKGADADALIQDIQDIGQEDSLFTAVEKVFIENEEAKKKLQSK